MPKFTQDEYLSPAQAARRLRLTPQRVVQLANAGRLPAVRTALGRLIPAAGIDEYARSRDGHQARAGAGDPDPEAAPAQRAPEPART